MATKKMNTNKAPTTEFIESVAEVTEQPTERPWQTIKRNPKLVFYAAIANIGPLMFGHDMVIIGAISALPQFRYVVEEHPMPNPVVRDAV
jgi:hypothetical protein